MGNCLGNLFGAAERCNLLRLGYKSCTRKDEEAEGEAIRIADADEDRFSRIGEVDVLGSNWEGIRDLGLLSSTNSTEKRHGKLNQFGIEYEDQCWVHKDVVEECFVPLAKQEEALVAHAMSDVNRRRVWVSHENSGIDVTGEKLQCLRMGGWLNDEVINLYLELLKEREQREPQKFLKCHFFNTFFYKKLISGRDGYNFLAVRRWTTQKKLGYSLLDCEKIFVPIHKGTHWCLAIINKKEKKFQYLDSLKVLDSQVLNVLSRYYVDEVKDKSGEDINVSSWKKEFVKNLPEQKNGYDCGMFMIKYTDFHSRNMGLCFDQADILYFRLRTTKEILNLKAE